MQLKQAFWREKVSLRQEPWFLSCHPPLLLVSCRARPSPPPLPRFHCLGGKPQNPNAWRKERSGEWKGSRGRLTAASRHFQRNKNVIQSKHNRVKSGGCFFKKAQYSNTYEYNTLARPPLLEKNLRNIKISHVFDCNKSLCSGVRGGGESHRLQRGKGTHAHMHTSQSPQ